MGDSLKSLELSISYETDEVDIVEAFYKPVLNCAKYYNRITGFFNSSSLIFSAEGIYNLIGENGKYNLLVSPELSEKDVMEITSIESLSDHFDNVFSREVLLNNDDVIAMHAKILCWLIKEEILEIRVCIPLDSNGYWDKDTIEKSGIFHQKVGVVEDVFGNVISFSGSINESLSGWTRNIEEFKVFKSWINGQSEYCKNDYVKFDKFWSNNSNKVETITLSKAIKEKIVKYAPSSEYELKKHLKKVKNNTFEKDQLSLFFYQEEALEKWRENNKQLLFEMATGTGKTRTAVACINDSISSGEKKLVIIATPQSTLSKQWVSSITELLPNITNFIYADGTNPNWRKRLEKDIFELNLGIGESLFVITTHATCSSLDFIEICSRCNKDTIFVGDEVHSLGSEKRKLGLANYSERIGLSATPSRWFDDEGSEALMDYFGNSSYVFGIERALTTINPLTNKTFLTDYYYNLEFCKLNEEELELYHELTEKINKRIWMDDDDDYLNKLYRDRKDIVKNANDKLLILDKILLKNINELSNTIIFVSDHQIDDVCTLLNNRGITYSRYTQSQGQTKKKDYNNLTEREYIIDLFKKKELQVLVAIKCLDEGIDIPSADTAILMASTTNPREYVQRIGRVIRRYEGKIRAHIYDIMVYSDATNFYSDKISNSELERIEYISSLSVNHSETIRKIDKNIRRII